MRARFRQRLDPSPRSAGLPAAAPRARRLVGEVGLEPTKASASGFTVRPLCRSGHSPEPRIPADAWSRWVMGSALGGVNRAKSARASVENATNVLILAPPHGTLAA